MLPQLEDTSSKYLEWVPSRVSNQNLLDRLVLKSKQESMVLTKLVSSYRRDLGLVELLLELQLEQELR